MKSIMVRNKKILLFITDEEIRNTLKNVLEEKGYCELFESENSEDYDCAFVDRNLVQIVSPTLMRRRKLPIPIILMNWQGETDPKVLAVAAKCYDTLWIPRSEGNGSIADAISRWFRGFKAVLLLEDFSEQFGSGLWVRVAMAS